MRTRIQIPRIHIKAGGLGCLACSTHACEAETRNPKVAEPLSTAFRTSWYKVERGFGKHLMLKLQFLHGHICRPTETYTYLYTQTCTSHADMLTHINVCYMHNVHYTHIPRQKTPKEYKYEWNSCLHFLFLWHFSCGPTGPQFINSDLCEQACPLRYVCDPVIIQIPQRRVCFLYSLIPKKYTLI